MFTLKLTIKFHHYATIISERVDYMFEELKSIINNAYAPISNYKVAAAVVTKDNKVYKGVNVEDASYRAGSCAERVAIFGALADGVKKGDFKEINIMVSSGKIGTPCFVCRQMILELFEKEAIVRCYSTNGDVQEFTVEELCPHPFTEEDLK